MPTLCVTRDHWWQIVQAARKHTGKENLPIYAAMLHYYNVCLVSVVTPLSIALWKLYQRIDGTKNETYASFANLPAFWVDACTVIDMEIARIQQAKDREDKQQQAEALKRIGSKT